MAYGSAVTNVNQMTKLTYFDASYSCINNSGIKNLNLYELDATDNLNITDVNFMASLKILHAGGINYGIKHLQLKELYVFGNKKITKKIK